MAKCSFCGEIMPRGRGMMYIKKDGKIFNFCTSKCEKNMLKLKRKPWTVRWTEDFQKTKQVKG